jgi:membrane protease YdiL (CAAX protease family)
MSALRRHFSGRIDPFTSAILVFPLFITYQVGILAGARGRNGVDFVTDALIRLCDRDLGTYLLLLFAMVVAYAAVLGWLRRKGRFTPGAFVPMLLEASVYAFFMGAVIQVAIARFVEFVPVLAIGGWNAAEILVISAGAGLHEELIFRALLMGGLARLFSVPLLPFGRVAGWIVALVASSVIFSLAHHVGPAGEVFTTWAFLYRTFAGLLFGLLYQLRGFAVAAWTHALYDVLVLAAAG